MEMDFAASMAALHQEMMNGITRGLQHHEAQQQENARLERVKATLATARMVAPPIAKDVPAAVVRLLNHLPSSGEDCALSSIPSAVCDSDSLVYALAHHLVELRVPQAWVSLDGGKVRWELCDFQTQVHPSPIESVLSFDPRELEAPEAVVPRIRLSWRGRALAAESRMPQRRPLSETAVLKAYAVSRSTLWRKRNIEKTLTDLRENGSPHAMYDEAELEKMFSRR